MKEKERNLIKRLLGEDILDKLEKSEISGGILKLNTNTVTDPNDIKIALQIVPRSVLSYLFMNLKDKQIGDIIDLDLPFAEAKLHINKLSPDNYSGDLVKEGKKIAEFKYRSLPSIGLILMSSLELYDTDQLNRLGPADYQSDKAESLQNLIDERLKLYDLVHSVVDKKISEREAIKDLIHQRITSELFRPQITIAPQPEEPEPDKKSKLKQFLEDRVNRAPVKEESIEMDKKEIKCPDCGGILCKGDDKISPCICFGENMGKEIKVKKIENGRVKIKFPKDFGAENIEMLLEALKNK
ncbi:MAG TPA: hypothetical protein VI911_11955 [Patescibacteria group bacterium]|nr:hypothetical protein [Patescibacteria group bacterium]